MVINIIDFQVKIFPIMFLLITMILDLIFSLIQIYEYFNQHSQ